MTIHESHAFVLEQARANIAFIKAGPGNVPQAQQINTSLAVIVTSERNMVMHEALKSRDKSLQNLPRA